MSVNRKDMDSGTLPADALAGAAAAALARLRDDMPRVHCITNNAAQAFTANGLLALGAVPSLTVNPREIIDFASSADAILINLGTLDRDRVAATQAVLEFVAEERRPLVVDPVMVDRSAQRLEMARSIVQREPDVIRANTVELEALAGGCREELKDIAALALDWLTVLAVSGAEDRVTDGARAARVRNGDALMMKVTAMGCLVSAVIAAFLPVSRSPFEAAVAGLGTVGVAGEMAAEKARGPGTFPVHFLDALAALTPSMLQQRLEVTDESD